MGHCDRQNTGKFLLKSKQLNRKKDQQVENVVMSKSISTLNRNLNPQVFCTHWIFVFQYIVIPTRRSTASAFQILVSHAFGDAGSPYLIGVVSISSDPDAIIAQCRASTCFTSTRVAARSLTSPFSWITSADLTKPRLLG